MELKNIFLRVSIQEKILFVKHLAMMIKAGMSIVDSLKMLKKQARSKSMGKIYDHLITEVSNGQFLSTALEKFKNIFGDFFVNIIRVGEASGILYENLNYLATELTKKKELQKKVFGALIYPIIIVIATFGITGLLTIYIFPKILPIFKSLNVKLPLSTKILISASEFLINYGIYAVFGIFGLVVLFFLLLRIKAVHYFFDRLLLTIPLFGQMSINYNMSNFCRTLGLLLKSDIKVVEAVSITGDTLKNLVYKNELKKIAADVTKGEEISLRLAEKKKLFPPMVSQMVSIGENTGNLSETLIYISEFYEKEVDDTAKNLSSILEPLLMILMGLIVAFIAISIITPIYEVTQGLNVK
ncbi:type II secretion system F family protein [Candidatus Wolfebacteria bacterium]|nr:type II secretion system F family protein [Candidatus Wolfebacteria bacterium]